MTICNSKAVPASARSIARLAFCVVLLASSGWSNAAGLVKTEAGFSDYSGPLGRLPTALDYLVDTYFVVNGGTPHLQAPTTPYAVGPAAGDSRAGTGFVDLSKDLALPPATSVEFYYGLWGDTTGSGFVRNVLSFTNSSATVDVGDIFKIATLNIKNGNWLVGDGTKNVPATISFTVQTESGIPALNGHVWSDTLIYENRSVYKGSDEDNADIFSFINSPVLGSFAVYDNLSGSIDIMGRIGSLTPMYLANPSGGVFLAPVPEPESYAMLVGGLGLLFVTKRRRKARRS